MFFLNPRTVKISCCSPRDGSTKFVLSLRWLLNRFKNDSTGPIDKNGSYHDFSNYRPVLELGHLNQVFVPTNTCAEQANSFLRKEQEAFFTE